MKIIKIIHLQVIPKLSGVQNISLEIMRHLPDDKYDKYILFSDTEVYGDINNCIDKFKEAGCKVILSPYMKREIGLSDIKALIELYKLFRREKFDIVHTHSTKPGIVGRIAAKMARVPYVIHTVHGLAFHKSLKWYLWVFYWACEMFASIFCDRIVLVNRYYARYFKMFNHKVVTIYNGIDFAKLR